MSLLRHLIRLALVVLLVVPVLTAAIDCGNPRNHRERFVCANPDLLSLDKQLSSVYEKALAATGMNRTDFQNAQRLWELDGGGCWDNVDCIKKRYNDRIAALEGVGQSAQLHVDGGTATSPNSENSEPVPAVAANENSPLTTPSNDPQEVPTANGDDQHAQQPEVKPSSNAVPAQLAKSESTTQPADKKKEEEPPPISGFILIGLGLIPAFVARKKGRTFWKWWIYGMFLLPIALPHALLMGHASQQTNQPNRSVQSSPAPSFTVLSPTDTNGIRQRLRQYSEYDQVECVHCGYKGHMGVVKRTTPLHENGMFKLMAFMGGAARNWYAASAFMGGVAKIILQCPACGSLWEKQVGDRPSMFLLGR